MAVPAGTFQAHQAIGNREDLSDVIYNISPVEFPFTSNIGRTTADNVKHEWQTDSLATVNTSNAAIEGDDATVLTAAPTVRLANYCQILTKAISVSGTQNAGMNPAGRKKELAYQIAKRGKELRRDLEAIASQNLGSTAGAAASARAMASLESWLFTNRTDLGSGGTPTTPGFISGIVAAPTDNSVFVTATKAALDAVIQACWTQGGTPEMVLCGPYNKTKISGFTGIATLYKEVPKGQATIVGGADVYVSNFGTHTIVPSRFSRDKTISVVDKDYWALAYLRPFQQFELSKTGDSEKRQMLCEVTLESKNEAASGKVTSLATS